MALFDDILKELGDARTREPDTERLRAHVADGAREVTVEAEDFDRLGIKIHKLKVSAPLSTSDPRPLQRILTDQGDALSGRKEGPFKDMAVTELDGRLGGGVLRTAPDAMERGYFYEAELSGGGAIEVRRRQRSEDGERHDAAFIASEETLPEMIGALGEALAAGRPEDPSEG